jgi:hypothetical protein
MPFYEKVLFKEYIKSGFASPITTISSSEGLNVESPFLSI